MGVIKCGWCDKVIDYIRFPIETTGICNACKQREMDKERARIAQKRKEIKERSEKRWK